MEYEGIVYRPPSEAHSFILQVTIGCAHNACTFCTMYRDKQFRIRSMEEIRADIAEVHSVYGDRIRRIFLADGDALVLPTKRLTEILRLLRRTFPSAERITSYGAPSDVLRKTDAELISIREAGLEMVYMGLESGDPEVLTRIHKGVTPEEIVEAGLRLKKAGIRTSVTLISGLGGRCRLQSHAEKSADALRPEEVVDEMELFLNRVDSPGTIFRANHASNYILLKGTLNGDIPEMIRQLDSVRAQNGFRKEEWRGL